MSVRGGVPRRTLARGSSSSQRIASSHTIRYLCMYILIFDGEKIRTAVITLLGMDFFQPHSDSHSEYYFHLSWLYCNVFVRTLFPSIINMSFALTPMIRVFQANPITWDLFEIRWWRAVGMRCDGDLPSVSSKRILATAHRIVCIWCHIAGHTIKAHHLFVRSLFERNPELEPLTQSMPCNAPSVNHLIC